MTATDRLDEIQARAKAASDGPWEAIPDDRTVGIAHVAIPESMHPTAWPDDAEFIAHARTDVPALVAGYRKIMDLHRPNQLGSLTTCVRCRDMRGTQVDYPCETVRAIEAALGVSS